MELNQLRCFVAAAEELHFGRAAQRLDMLPSALSRHIRLLEDDLGTRLMTRTTRSVALTGDGVVLLREARMLLEQADGVAAKLRARGRSESATIRVGAIDSAAAGLLPMLLHETAVVAVSDRHPLASRKRIGIADLAEQPLIVPERRSRPHSHDLTMKLFARAGLPARVVQLADEKQTIVNLVAAELGVAIVPRWTSRMATRGVRYIPLAASNMRGLPLAAAWTRGTRDRVRDEMLETLKASLKRYAREA